MSGRFSRRFSGRRVRRVTDRFCDSGGGRVGPVRPVAGRFPGRSTGRLRRAIPFGGNANRLGQQLDSARSAARRAGCQRFFFFGPKPNRNCPAIMARVDQLERAVANAGGRLRWRRFLLRKAAGSGVSAEPVARPAPSLWLRRAAVGQRQLPDTVRAGLRWLLFPDQLCDQPHSLQDRCGGLPVALSAGRSRPLRAPHDRRGCQRGGIAER